MESERRETGQLTAVFEVETFPRCARSGGKWDSE